MQGETRFKIKALDRLREIPNSWWVKIQQRSMRGTPDILGCIKGQFVAIELKVGDGRVDKLQEWTLHQIKKTGAQALVMRPENFESMIAHLEKL